MPFILILVATLGLALLYRAWRRRHRRAGLLASVLEDDDRATIMREVPILRRLPFELRSALEGKIALFLDQVDFNGCNGLEVTREMELSIAAQASLLVVNSDTWYDRLTTILVYPAAFKSMVRRSDGLVVTEEEIVRQGESWTRGPVVLSWADSARGAQDDADGHNVVLHEFAHQLDDLSGHTDGAPVMRRGQDLYEWERVFVEAYERHAENVERGRGGVLGDYAATNQQEYFAVAVELFFERPGALECEEPQVYAQLAQLLRLDPASWAQAEMR